MSTLVRCIDCASHLLLINHPSVRMNFSHGSYEYHQSVIDNTRKMVAGELSALPASFRILTVLSSQPQRPPCCHCSGHSTRASYALAENRGTDFARRKALRSVLETCGTTRTCVYSYPRHCLLSHALSAPDPHQGWPRVRPVI